MKLVPLGINGYLPINGRHSSCFLVLFDDAAFLLDAGTGAARLHEPEVKALLKDYRELHLILSHYHVDHTVGLYYAFTAFPDGDLHIHAPVCPYVQADPVEAIQRYFSPPLNSYELKDTRIKIHPINKTSETISRHRFTFWPQRHPGGSIGIRLDDHLAYITDTVVMMEHVDKVRGISLLLHEMWLNERDTALNEKENLRHACFPTVAEFVRAADPALTMPVHLYPHYTDAELKEMTQLLEKRSGKRVELPVEGRIYTRS